MHSLQLAIMLLLFTSRTHAACDFSVDISSGHPDKENNAFVHEGVRYPEGKFYPDGGETRGCPCDFQTCVNLCCPRGQAKIDNVCQEFDWEPDVQGHTDYYELATEHNCTGIVLHPEEDSFYITEDSRLFSEGFYFPLHEYCLSTFTSQDNTTQAHICINHFYVEEHNHAFSYGILVSVVFFLLTLAVLYQIQIGRNIDNISQICYVFSIMCAYMSLALIQLMFLSSTACTIMATLCLYFFMSSFWSMHFFCKEIYWTVSGEGSHTNGFVNRKIKYRKFTYFCLHAYLFPLIHVVFVHAMNSIDDIGLWYHPNFVTNQCWFMDGIPVLLYFYGVMGLILLTNIVLFVLSVLKIKKLKLRPQTDNRSGARKYIQTRERFILYLKLLVLFGITWTLEFISWTIDWLLGSYKIAQIWYLLDMINALFGVFVFYIFVCNRKTMVLLRRRYYQLTGQLDKITDISLSGLYYPMMPFAETGQKDEETLLD